jgi:EPS-associated MarR family transcriptional regulator
MTEESHYLVLKMIEANPQISQRELASALGVSLGKANYCLRALVEKGWVKARNFKNAKNKVAYSYIMTPRGIEEKSKITVSFLATKISEYEALKEEIDDLRLEAERLKLKGKSR